MSTGDPGRGYTYPTNSNDPDQQDVLRNRLDLRSRAALNRAEYRITSDRMIDIRLGSGPAGNFDAAHLKTIHQHLFGEIYEWAGHTRNERPVVDGWPVEPIEFMTKGSTTFLPGSRLDRGLAEAFRPIHDPDVLKGSNVEQFSAVAGRVMSELNFVHPFREGNGRVQEAFIATLGQKYGHDVDFSVITKPRMLAASITGADDPANPAMRHLVEDATDRGRVAALRTAFEHLRQQGAEPLAQDVRTARPGEQITGVLLATDTHSSSVNTGKGIIVVPTQDLGRQRAASGDDVTVTVKSGFSAAAADRTAQEKPAASQRAASYWSGQVQKGQGARSSPAGVMKETDAPAAKPRGPKLR